MAAVKYKNRREYLDFYADEAVRRLGSEFEGDEGRLSDTGPGSS